MSSEGPVTPFVDLPRAAWARLAKTSPTAMDQTTIDQLRGVGDPTSLADVVEVFHPLTELIGHHARDARQLSADSAAFLGLTPAPTPFVVGITGSVAVGKSTVARLVAELLRRAPERPRVELVTTDGFLLSNATLAAQGLLDRKGFPPTYDTEALLRFAMGVKSGVSRVRAPVYSHVIYDVVAGACQVIERPDILVLEGLNLLQPPGWHGANGDAVQSVADFLDFSVYVDADPGAIREWFIARFLQLRATAFSDPASYFRQFADLGDADAKRLAGQTWDDINGPNLTEHIAPTMPRATVILRKGPNHAVESVRIRQV